jgi:hypothetical protein
MRDGRELAGALRPLWCNRSGERLKKAEEELKGWFASHTSEVQLGDFAFDGRKVHVLRRGEVVDFCELLGALEGRPVSSVVIQDPYLRTPHQLACLGAALEGLAPLCGGDAVQLRVTTKLSNPRLGERDAFGATEHRPAIDEWLGRYPMFDSKLDLRSPRESMHLRFLLAKCGSGADTLYLFERGLDLTDPRTGQCRADTVVVEFSPVAPELLALTGE